MTRLLLVLGVGCLVLVGAGCARATSGACLRLSAIPVYGGYNTGGVIEDVDAVTSATHPMYSAGAHVEFEVLGHPIETGLDWHGLSQTLEVPRGVIGGDQGIKHSQLRLPLTYNLDLIRNSRGHPILGLKLGASAGYSMQVHVEEVWPSHPYSFTSLDVGPLLGASWHPVHFRRCAFGVFAELHRGAIVWDDWYEWFGNLSFLRAGLTIRAHERQPD